MRPAAAQVPLQWCKASVATPRMPKQHSSTALRRRLKPKAYSNLLSRFLAPRRFSKWISMLAERFASAMALDPQTLVFAAMQTPVARLTDDLWGRFHMQTNSSLPTSLSRRIDVDTRCNAQCQKVDSGLVDKAVTWMLAPVFFCCVAAEKAKPPQNWEATAIFSRVVVSFMLKLFVLMTNLTEGQQQAVRRLEEGK